MPITRYFKQQAEAIGNPLSRTPFETADLVVSVADASLSHAVTVVKARTLPNGQVRRATNPLRLVKFKCGCVGTEPLPGGEFVLLSHCTDAAHPQFRSTVMTEIDEENRAFEVLDAGTAALFVRQVAELIRDGLKFQKLQGLLGIPKG